MKTLTLLRHAKSDWTEPRQRDFDRPLNRRGHAAARAMGRAMVAEGMRFDVVLASPAARVVETLEGLTEACGRDFAPAFDPDLYLASPATLLDKIHELADDTTSLLIIGHNPGLEQLAMLLSATGDEAALEALSEKYPTATLAAIRLDVASWADVAKGRGTLTRFLRPRDLDPALGPDD